MRLILRYLIPAALAFVIVFCGDRANRTAHSDLLGYALGGIGGALALGLSHGLFSLRTANRRLKERSGESTPVSDADGEGNRFLAASVDLLAVIRADGVCERVNPAFENLLGWTPEEWRAKPLVEFLHPDDRSILARELGHAMKGETVENIEVRCRRKDGTECWIAWSAAAANSDGRLFVSGRDVSARKSGEGELDEIYAKLLKTSRQAGMAEIATEVLHNVGNVLNSVNVSAGLLAETVKKSRIAKIGRVADLLEQNATNLTTFMTESAQGRSLPGYLRQLHSRLVQEQQEMLPETASLQRNIDYIKDIVTMQQAHVQVPGVAELIKVNELVEDSLRSNAAALDQHGIVVERDLCDLPVVSVEKHKVLQILGNMICNARHACEESGRAEKNGDFAGASR